MIKCIKMKISHTCTLLAHIPPFYFLFYSHSFKLVPVVVKFTVSLMAKDPQTALTAGNLFIIHKACTYLFNIELMPINIEFIKRLCNIYATQKFGQSPCTLVHGFRPDLAKNEKEKISF